MDEFQLLIAGLKDQHGEVYHAVIEDDEFIFRMLTRKEYADIIALTSDKDLQDELVCQLAVVYPVEIQFSNVPAGIPQTLAPFVVNESGFGNLRKADMYFNEYKAEMNNFERQAEAMIQAAFPQITEEEMSNWSVSKFMRLAAKAEWILQNIHGYPVEFQKMQEGEGTEEEEEPEPPTMKELGNEMRQEGLDPMIEYAPYILKKRPFAEVPFIGGTQYWKKV